jgi:hypothetical protein
MKDINLTDNKGYQTDFSTILEFDKDCSQLS